MQWLRVLLAKLFNVPVSIDLKRFVYKGEPIERFDVEHYEAWAKLWQSAPGLHDSWLAALGATVHQMSKTPATDAHNGERIRLCQRAVDQWQNLQIPIESAKKLNEIYREQVIKQVESGEKQLTARNVL